MTKQTINIGTSPDDGEGDDIRIAFAKCNANFDELYAASAPYTDEQVRDVIAAALDAGSNITITPDDGADTITIEATGGGGGGLTAEQVMDQIAAMLTAGSNVTLTYNDGADTLTVAAAGGGGGGSAIEVLDEGVSETAALVSLDFTGAGVTATDDGSGNVTVTVSNDDGAIFRSDDESSVIIPINGVTTLTALGVVATVSGNVARTMATTNAFTRQRRIGIVTTASANAFAQVRSAQVLCGTAGWHFRGRFGVATAAASGRLICGAHQGWTGATDPSVATDLAAVAKDAADTNLQIMVNDASGTATKTDLGVNFPANTSGADYYDVELTVAVGGASLEYRVTRVNTGDVATGTVAANLPTPGGYLSFGIWAGTGTAAAQGVDMMHVYARSLAA